MTREQMKQALISILIGAITIFLVNLLQHHLLYFFLQIYYHIGYIICFFSNIYFLQFVLRVALLTTAIRLVLPSDVEIVNL